MESYIEIFYKGILSIVVLFIFTKIMGKKQVGQLNIFDYVIGITIGSIAAEMTMNEDITVIDGAIGIFVYAITAYLISIVTMKSIYARRVFMGTPCVIIQDGKILENSLRKSRIDINDLLQEARSNGYFDISQIEFAIMEDNGRISFLPKAKFQPLTLSDMKIKADYKGVCANLVIDGNIMDKHLEFIKKDRKWLLTRLEKEGYTDVNDLILVTIDTKEKLHIYERNFDIEAIQPFE